MISKSTSLDVDLERLLSEYAKPSKSPTFEIYYPRGEAITCKLPERFGDWGDYEEAIREFWRVIQSRHKCPESWQQILPISFKECVAVVALKFWAIEPAINDLQALKHVRLGGGAILRGLYEQIQKRIDHEGYDRFLEEMEEEGNDSSEMDRAMLPQEQQQSISISP